MSTLKYSMVVLLSLFFSGTLAKGYTLIGDGGTMCAGNGGRWKYVYGVEDLSVCVTAVLADPSCSNEFFSHSTTDGNCWCVPVGTDCTTQMTTQNNRNTYSIDYRYELVGNGGTMCSRNGGSWTNVKNVDDLSVCMGTVLADESCSHEFFSHSTTDGNCWCVPVGTDCSDEDNLRTQNRRNTYSITDDSGDSNTCCQAMTAECLSCGAGITEEEYCAQYPTTVGCEADMCCQAMTAECLSCAAGITEEEYCAQHPTTDGCETDMCCQAMTAECLSCAAGITEEEYCAQHPTTDGCESDMCCQAMTAECLSCALGTTVEKFCAQYPKATGCKAVSVGRLLRL